MASIRKKKSGSWRAQVRRKGRSVSENFVRYEDAKHWAVDARTSDRPRGRSEFGAGGEQRADGSARLAAVHEIDR